MSGCSIPINSSISSECGIICPYHHTIFFFTMIESFLSQASWRSKAFTSILLDQCTMSHWRKYQVDELEEWKWKWLNQCLIIWIVTHTIDLWLSIHFWRTPIKHSRLAVVFDGPKFWVWNRYFCVAPGLVEIGHASCTSCDDVSMMYSPVYVSFCYYADHKLVQNMMDFWQCSIQVK